MRAWSHRLRPPMIPPGRRSTIAALAGVIALVAVGLSMCGASASLRHVTASGARASGVNLGAGRQIAAPLEARIDGETRGTLTTVHFYSQGARQGRPTTSSISPPGTRPPIAYRSSTCSTGCRASRSPSPSTPTSKSGLERLIRERRVTPMILVFPDGRVDGRTASDSEWANTPSGNYEELRHRRRPGCRSALRHAARASGPRDRRPVGGRIRRGERRPAPRRAVRPDPGLVRLLRGDT